MRKFKHEPQARAAALDRVGGAGRGPLARRARELLGHRRLPLGVALVAIVLTLPSVFTGWVVDDYFHRVTLTGEGMFAPFVRARFDLFQFFDGDPQRTWRMMDLGFAPWWTYPHIRGAFWRPLTVLTHWLDYQLWPNSPALMHVQSVLWWGAAAAAVAWLYRRLMAPAWLAGLAALLYAIDDARAMPVGFLANRNALPAVLFGVLALLAHDSWRRGGRRGGAWLAPLLLAASLLSAEAGIATCAYLAAHAVFLDRAGWRRGLLALSPYVVVVVAWRVAWSAQGYGVAGIGLYVDPLNEPLRFLQTLGTHAPLLLLGQWAGPPPELSILLTPTGAAWHWRAAVVVVAAMTLIVWPLVRRDRLARFWALGMLLALVPVCATFPADRLLVFAGIGAFGLIAQFLRFVFDPANRAAAPQLWRGPAKVMAGLLVVIHLGLAPLALPLRSSDPCGARLASRYALRLPADVDLAGRELIVVNLPNFLHGAYFLPEREAAGLPVPQRLRVLASGMQAVDIRRPDARTLVIRPQRGFISWRFEELVRDERFPMHIGERVALTGMTVKVTALTDDERPAEARFGFDVPLEDPRLYWVCYRDGGFQPFDLPAVGERLSLPAP